jgi:uncharacterized protein (DUF849 family)
MDVIVNFTPTGMIPTKDMTPHVPITPSEIAEDVHRAVEAGITMVHLHARNPETGEPTYRAEAYGRIIEKIRAFTKDLIICVSLSGRNFPELEKRSEPLELTGDLKPDMGSLTLSSVNFNQTASVSEPETIKGLAERMQQRGVLAELEAFDVGMINYARYLIHKGLLRGPHYFNLLLGNIACAQPNLLHLGMMLNDLPEDAYWSVAGIGSAQLAMNSISIACGGGVRVGLEDNIWLDAERTHLARNIDLVNRVHTLIEANGRRVMQPADLRQKLGLHSSPGRYGRDD